jgi:tripartite ATP-independent transporter DctM subunit
VREVQSKRGVIILVIFLLFIILLLLGVPIVFALLVPGIAACLFFPDIPLQLMGPRLVNSFLSSTLVAIPMFVFAAQILTDIKVSDKIFSFVNKCVGHVRGGLAHVNVVASVVFAGMSGSAVADAAGLGKVEIKAMNDQGYPKPFSAAVTAASATIGPIVPPSISAIIYGAMASVSIGKLLIGGFLPGLIMAIMMMFGIAIIAKRRGFLKTKFAGLREISKEFFKALPGLMAPIIIVGGMLFGFFTPTEAATVSVVYAIVVGFCLKTLTFKGLCHSFKQAAIDGAAMLITFIGASLIGLIVTRLHIADTAISFMTGLTTSPIVLLLMLNVFLLIIGCLLDINCSIILLTPILVPLVQSYGIDPIHFGIVMILNLMIGLLTPPMGALLFVIGKVAEVSMMDILKEVWPFLIWLSIALLIVTFVPQTVLWLPSLFIK